MAKTKPLVCVSGYFNPVHIGHIRMIRSAAKLGRVIVIVNNDYQVKLKGSIPLMLARDRAEIMAALAGVERSVISIDRDRTVCKTLTKIKPDIFCNGGDRTKNNIPELDTCTRLGIKIIFGVGGRKVRSSSHLLKKSSKKTSFGTRLMGADPTTSRVTGECSTVELQPQTFSNLAKIEAAGKRFAGEWNRTTV